MRFTAPVVPGQLYVVLHEHTDTWTPATPITCDVARSDFAGPIVYAIVWRAVDPNDPWALVAQQDQWTHDVFPKWGNECNCILGPFTSAVYAQRKAHELNDDLDAPIPFWPTRPVGLPDPAA